MPLDGCVVTTALAWPGAAWIKFGKIILHLVYCELFDSPWQTNIHPIGKMQCIFILTVQQFRSYLFSVIITMHVNNQATVTLRVEEAAEAMQEWAGSAPVEDLGLRSVPAVWIHRALHLYFFTRVIWLGPFVARLICTVSLNWQVNLYCSTKLTLLCPSEQLYDTVYKQLLFYIASDWTVLSIKLLVDVASAKERWYIGHFMLSSCKHLAEPLPRRSLPPRHAYLGLCM